MTFLNPDKRSDSVTCKYCDGDAVRCCSACGEFGCEKHVPAATQPVCRNCLAKSRRKTAALLLAGGALTGLLILVTHWLR